MKQYTFVSNPLVREYIKEKQLAKSTYSEILNKDSEKKSLIDLDAASRIISKYFNSSELKEKVIQHKDILRL